MGGCVDERAGGVSPATQAVSNVVMMMALNALRICPERFEFMQHCIGCYCLPEHCD
jgi:hypothetical protein